MTYVPHRFADAFDVLHETASASAGMTDFGDTGYHAGLRVLLQSLDEDVPFSEFGRQFVFGTLVGTLVSRLFTEVGWKRHPEYRRAEIRRPVVITGIPRSGTTALHKLMSMDPQFQGLELWLTWTPMVRPPRDTWESNPCYQGCVQTLAQMHTAMPGLAATHDMTPDTVDECLEVIKQSFVSNRFGSTFGCSSYETWWWRQDEHASFRRYADVLRLIGLADPDRRWLVKNPGHIWALDSVFENFPDACVIQTHRDPAKCIPSLCSLLSMVQQAVQGENFRPGTRGPIEAVKWHQALHRADAVRRGREKQIHDVRHRDFYADPIGVVKAIYRRFDLELTAETEARMRHWLANQPPEQKGAHQYTAEMFGLSEGGLRELYGNYIQRYGLV